MAITPSTLELDSNKQRLAPSYHDTRYQQIVMNNQRDLLLLKSTQTMLENYAEMKIRENKKDPHFRVKNCYYTIKVSGGYREGIWFWRKTVWNELRQLNDAITLMPDVVRFELTIYFSGDIIAE